MNLIDKFKDLFQPKTTRLDVSKRFELERHAFNGTMSKFRVAKEIGTGRRLGLKLLDEEKTDLFNQRFKGLDKPPEGVIGMAIKHPRVVETFEFGTTTTGQEYILMEYIDGPGLNTLINEDSDKYLDKRLSFIRQMAEAVQAVHDAGYIHRDVCPRNFICDSSLDWLKLIDFGLTVPDLPEFRQPGNRTGTPQYMAPEIVRRRETDIRVDIFAYGVSVYRMLTKEHPWGSTETSGLAALAHDARDPTDILKHRPNLHPKLAKAVNACLSKKPDDRPANANAFLHMIRDVETEVS